MRVTDYTLPQMMALACYYAQAHIDDDCDCPPMLRETMLQCTSYQIACFLAQNTVRGSGGVEWGVVIEELIARPMKDTENWLKIINNIAAELGGWK